MNRREWLKQLRLDSLLTQAEVARYLDVSLRYYQMIEQGVKTPSIKIAARLGNLLGFDLMLLFLEVENEKV